MTKPRPVLKVLCLSGTEEDNFEIKIEANYETLCSQSIELQSLCLLEIIMRGLEFLRSRDLLVKRRLIWK